MKENKIPNGACALRQRHASSIDFAPAPAPCPSMAALNLAIRIWRRIALEQIALE
jgi:hypothetical protein